MPFGHILFCLQYYGFFHFLYGYLQEERNRISELKLEGCFYETLRIAEIEIKTCYYFHLPILQTIFAPTFS